MTDTKKYHILLIEDEQFLRDLYVQVLGEKGFVVDVAEDGEAGYTKLISNKYDLVLLDIILPKMDGLQILEKLSKEKAGVTSPIVLLTNLGQDLVVSKALGYGIRGYMIKSDYNPEELVQEVWNYVTTKDSKPSAS